MNFIMDNLIAERKARPMLVVMEQGYARRSGEAPPQPGRPGAPRDFTRMFSAFEEVMVKDLIPTIDAAYRTIPDREHRAMAGLSMGGGQAASIGLANPDLFHYVLSYSGAIGSPFANVEVVSKPEALNSKLRLLWVSCGKQDFLYQANRQFVESLKAKGVNVTFRETEGAHVWSVWRHNLNDTAPLLFTGLGGKKK
jgi:enterochelin esterase family protein